MTPHLRTSERKDFKRCQFKWQQVWRKGLKPRTQKPDALWFGTGIHLALQERYKYQGLRRGENVLKVWRDFVGDEIASVRVNLPGEYMSEETAWVEAGELGEAMLGNYLDKYGKDERWYVISAEQSFEIPIPRPVQGDGDGDGSPLVLYNGTFDLVAMDLWESDTDGNDKSLWLWDHKTAKAIRTGHLSLDDQAGSYWAFAADVLAAQGLIEPGMKLEGILYNFLRKGKPDERPTNAQGLATNKPTKAHYLAALKSAGIIALPNWTLDRLSTTADNMGIIVQGDASKIQPSALFLREPVFRTASERRTQIQRIQAEALQMEAIRSGLLPITKTPTMDCEWCPLFSMCELHENGDDWLEFRELSFTRKDPYAAHRESADTGE